MSESVRRRHGMGMWRDMRRLCTVRAGRPRNLAQRELEAVRYTQKEVQHGWAYRISRSATVPGLKRCCFFTPVCSPAVGADLRAAFEARAFRGALPPVDLRAVCFVRAIYLIPKPEF